MIDSGTLEENGVVEVKFMTALIDERNMMGGFSTECALYAARFTMPARVGSNDCKGRLKSTLQALWMIRETVCWRFSYMDGTSPRARSSERSVVRKVTLFSGTVVGSTGFMSALRFFCKVAESGDRLRQYTRATLGCSNIAFKM